MKTDLCFHTPKLGQHRQQHPQHHQQPSNVLILHRCPGKPRPGRPTKKSGPVKKNGKLDRQRQHISKAADMGARGCRVKPRGAYALLARTDGQLRQAGQRYYSPWGCPPQGLRLQPAPHPQAQQLHSRNGQKKLVRSLEGDGEHRLTKLGKAFRDKYYEPRTGGHPRPAARAERGRGLRAERLASTDYRNLRTEVETEPAACRALQLAS